MRGGNGVGGGCGGGDALGGDVLEGVGGDILESEWIIGVCGGACGHGDVLWRGGGVVVRFVLQLRMRNLAPGSDPILMDGG